MDLHFPVVKKFFLKKWSIESDNLHFLHKELKKFSQNNHFESSELLHVAKSVQTSTLRSVSVWWRSLIRKNKQYNDGNVLCFHVYTLARKYVSQLSLTTIIVFLKGCHLWAFNICNFFNKNIYITLNAHAFLIKIA